MFIFCLKNEVTYMQLHEKKKKKKNIALPIYFNSICDIDLLYNNKSHTYKVTYTTAPRIKLQLSL